MKIEIRPGSTIKGVLNIYKLLSAADEKDKKLNIQIFEYLDIGEEIQVSQKVIVKAVKGILRLGNITHLTFMGSEKDAFTIQTLKALKKVLIEVKTLKDLDLTGRLLGDEAIPTVVKILEGNPSIKTLNLSGNKITDKGADILHDFFETDKCLLENLVIGANKIKNANLFLNNKLYYVNVAGNKITEIKDNIEAENLKMVDFSENPVHTIGQAVIPYFLNKSIKFIIHFTHPTDNEGIELSASAYQSTYDDFE